MEATLAIEPFYLKCISCWEVIRRVVHWLHRVFMHSYDFLYNGHCVNIMGMYFPYLKLLKCFLPGDGHIMNWLWVYELPNLFHFHVGPIIDIVISLHESTPNACNQSAVLSELVYLRYIFGSGLSVMYRGCAEWTCLSEVHLWVRAVCHVQGLCWVRSGWLYTLTMYFI